MQQTDCYECGAPLGALVRLTVDNDGNKADKNGKPYVFCPTNHSLLAPDCVNSFLRKLNPKRRKGD